MGEENKSDIFIKMPNGMFLPVDVVCMDKEIICTVIEDKDEQTLPSIYNATGAFSCNLKNVNKRFLYQIFYGNHVANNWRKMHGKPMIRKGKGRR